MSSQGAIIALILLLLYRLERARDTEREVELKMRSSQTVQQPGSLPHYRGTEIKRGLEQGMGGLQRKGPAKDQEWEILR